MEWADQCVELSLGVAMADWVRNTVMLAVVAIWSVFVAVTLLRGDDVDAIVWGVPGAVYFSLNPTFRKKDGKDGPA